MHCSKGVIVVFLNLTFDMREQQKLLNSLLNCNQLHNLRAEVKKGGLTGELRRLPWSIHVLGGQAL
jgi:hypothetical protein